MIIVMSAVIAKTNGITTVPNMTSATAPSGTVTASNFTTGFEPWKAFNSALGDTRWLTASGSTTGWLAYEWGSGISRAIVSYAITGHPNTPSVNPRNWTFDGWTGSAWVTLDTRTGQTGWAVNERRVYSFSNSTAYIRYRINITANDGQAEYTGISYFEWGVRTLYQ